MYYIKKLGFQELGSPKDGKTFRGRYFLISKKNEGFFPFLSETEFNDAVLIPIVLDGSDEKIYCTFKFHNSAFHPQKELKKKHNEYRLYLNQTIDPGKKRFQLNDIVVFNRLITEDLIPVYELFLIRPENPNYLFLSGIITSSSIQGGHALYEGLLPFISERTIRAIDNLKTIIPDEVKDDVAEIQNSINEFSEIEKVKGANLFNSVSFRDFVLLGYQNKCAVTNEAIVYEKLVNLEAAHIMPKSHTGSFLPCNGIAMSRDMHWAFDKGMFTIDENFRILVHEDLQSSILGKFHNQEINLPAEVFFRPEPKFLKYHRERVFGLFKFSGTLRSI